MHFGILKFFMTASSAFLISATGGADATGLVAYYDFEQLPADRLEGEATLTSGLRGQALKIGDDGHRMEFCRLPNKGLFTGQECTVSFWVSPLDWDGTREGFIFLLGAALPDNTGMRIYKYTGNGGFLWFLVGNRNGDATAMQDVFGRINDWKRGQWHHIAVTYRPGGKTFIGKESRQRIYLDGKLVGEKSVPEEKQPAAFPETWTIGPAERWGEAGIAHSAVDELKIFSRELSPDEIKAEYLRLYIPESGKPGCASAGMISGSGTVFGTEFERAAAQSNLFYDSRGLLQQTLHDPECAVAASPDELLIRIRENVAGLSLKTAAANRDGPVFLDDSYEIIVARENLPYRQYVVNSAGVMYDGIGMDGSWNGSATAASRIENGVWTLEIRIPASDLQLKGFKPSDRFQLGIGRNYLASGQRLTFGTCDFRGYFHQPEVLQTFSLLSAGNSGTRIMVKMDSARLLAVRSSIPVSWRYSVNGGTPETVAPAEEWQFPLIRMQSAARYEGRLVSQDGTFEAQLAFVIEPRLLVTSELDPETSDVLLHLQPASGEDAALFAGGSVTVYADGKAVAERPYAPVLRFSPGELPSHSFALEARITGRDGKNAASGFLNYYFIDYAQWRNYDGGMDDNDVPAPWVPVDYRNGTLFCLNREYRLSEGFLPLQTLVK